MPYANVQNGVDVRRRIRVDEGMRKVCRKLFVPGCKSACEETGPSM